MGKYVIRKTGTGIKLDLGPANGQVITASEVYNPDGACENGIVSIKKNAMDGEVITE